MERIPERYEPLHGMRIMLVEDEFLILVWLEDALCEAGAETISAATIPAAMNIATGEPLSAALLDVRLGRQTTETVADALAARGVPFVFYSGQALPEDISAKYPRAPILQKPSKIETLIHEMVEVARR